MEFLSQYGLFILKTFTMVFAILIIIGGGIALGRKEKPKLSITSLNELHSEIRQQIYKEVYGKKPEKVKIKKQNKKSKKNKTSNALSGSISESAAEKFYVIDFDGDMKASQVENLREAITAVLSVATTQDEIILRLTSPGGSVNGYGLAASQLQRIRNREIPLTVCIDTIAASGGYLMACVAPKILAAPFAIIGSIGVVAQLPNFHRWLKKHDVDFELITAGEYKRTLTVFGENTDKGREKFREDLEDIHKQFRNFVLEHRQNIDIDKIATGEHWLGTEALKLNLVDEIQTSDDYVLSKLQTKEGFHIKIHTPTTVVQKILKPAVKFLQPW